MSQIANTIGVWLRRLRAAVGGKPTVDQLVGSLDTLKQNLQSEFDRLHNQADGHDQTAAALQYQAAQLRDSAKRAARVANNIDAIIA